MCWIVSKFMFIEKKWPDWPARSVEAWDGDKGYATPNLVWTTGLGPVWDQLWKERFMTLLENVGGVHTWWASCATWVIFPMRLLGMMDDWSWNSPETSISTLWLCAWLTLYGRNPAAGKYLLLSWSFQNLSELKLLVGGLEVGSCHRGRNGEAVTCHSLVLRVLDMGQQACQPHLALSGLTTVTLLLYSASVFHLSMGTVISAWSTAVGCCEDEKLESF